jgi:hypothetical protein
LLMGPWGGGHDFAADMVGYSRLMETDEAGTLAQLRSTRSELIALVPAEVLRAA